MRHWKIQVTNAFGFALKHIVANHVLYFFLKYKVQEAVKQLR